MTIGILAASSSSILIRFAQHNAPSLVIAAYRMGISSLVLWLFIALTGHRSLAQLDRPARRQGFLAGFFLSIHFAAWITSLEYTSITSSVVLVTTSPLFVAVLSPIFLGERIRRVTILGLLLAFSGAILVAAADSGGSLNSLGSLLGGSITRRALFGDILALTGAAAGAGYIMAGRSLRKRISLLPYVTISYTSAAVLLTALVVLLQMPLTAYPPETFLWFLLLALIPQLIAHTSINWALHYLPAAFVSISLLGEPVGTSILAYIIFREIPTPLVLAGAGLIFSGIILASRSNRKFPADDSD